MIASLAYTLGWRVDSEILPLTWSQVDFGQGTLRLEPGSTKNKDGRLVYLTPELKAGLVEQRKRVIAMERELGQVIRCVFPLSWGSRTGRQRKDIRRFWERACRLAGCPEKLKHDLQRTAVRNMVQVGVSERVAMTITGHRTREVFMMYQIVAPGDLQDAARKMSQIFLRHNPGHSHDPRSEITGPHSTYV